MLFPTLLRAYSRVKGMAEDMEAEPILHLLLKETRNYCAANPHYQFDTKFDLADKCGLAPKCKDWVKAPATEFVPFTYLDPTNKLVLSFHVGRNHATLYAFDKGELCDRPPER